MKLVTNDTLGTPIIYIDWGLKTYMHQACAEEVYGMAIVGNTIRTNREDGLLAVWHGNLDLCCTRCKGRLSELPKELKY